MLPDDCSECVSCGVPVFGRGRLCLDCEPVRDNRGRFVAREIADRYRALVRVSLWLTGATEDEVLAARRQLATFWS